VVVSNDLIFLLILFDFSSYHNTEYIKVMSPSVQQQTKRFSIESPSCRSGLRIDSPGLLTRVAIVLLIGIYRPAWLVAHYMKLHTYNLLLILSVYTICHNLKHAIIGSLLTFAP